MIPVISTEEAARLDEQSPVDELMERAGLAVALAAVGMGAGYGKRVEVLAGPGNNGGDGYVAARYLHSRGVGVTVRGLTPPRTEAARRASTRARMAGVAVTEMRLPAPCDLIVDALFGGRPSRGIPDEVSPWFSSDAPVIAVDGPTGMDLDTGEAPDGSFKAALTVTFHAPKPGHFLGDGPDLCGAVKVADIGLIGGEPSFRLVEGSDLHLPGRSRQAHKWSAGSVLVVGGSPGMTGAVVLAGRAALRFGAGAVGVAAPASSLGVIASQAPELLSYSIDDLASISHKYDVLLIGPGLGNAIPSVRALLENHTGAVVLDADGINGIGADALSGRQAPSVITPHAGEFKRLTGVEAGYDSAQSLARRTGSIVLLKGNPTFVTDGTAPWLVTANGPELASIGTGDVLAGMVSALVARGVEPVCAAYTAAHIHGEVAASLVRSGTVTADRLVDQVGTRAWEYPV